MALIDNLVSYYKLDETSGTTAYDSHGSNHGTNNGAKINVAGKIDRAYDFEGSNNNYINLNTIDATSWTGYTFSAWVKFESWYSSPNTAGTIVSISGSNVDSGVILEQANDTGVGSRIHIHIMDSSTADKELCTYPISSLSLGTWYHIVATIDDSTNNANLYINGVNVSSYSSPFNIKKTTLDTAFIGAQRRYGPRRYFDGVIDEVGIWNRALSSTEVSELYNSGNGLAYPFFTGPDFTKFQINIGDNWKQCAGMKINIGDSWKEVSSAKINIGDSWKTII